MISNGSYTSADVFYIDDICLDLTHPVQCGDVGTPYYQADFNLDCVVNLKDLSVLASAWLNEQSRTECTDPGKCTYPFTTLSSNPPLMYLKSDMDQNTFVNSSDLKRFAEQWLLHSQF
jgi:hypothetical protein